MDIFVFHDGDGDDEIIDFTAGEDHLVLDEVLAVTLIETLDQSGDGVDDTLLTLSSGDSILLHDLSGIDESNVDSLINDASVLSVLDDDFYS